MNQTLIHAHLLLNHFPTVGFSIGIGLLIGALVSKSDDLKRVSLVVLVGIALLTIPTYVTGNAARDLIAASPDVDTPATFTAVIDAHEGAALWSSMFIGLVGAVAWFALWQLRRSSRISGWSLSALLGLSVVSLVLVMRAANLGGEIRHPEIRAIQEGTMHAGNLGRTIGSAITNTPWVWPVMETLHFIGLSLLFGAIGLINVRVLGVMKQVSVAALDRLLPWAILGFALNVITGLAFFIGAPEQYTSNFAFYWKVALVEVAGANALYFTVFDSFWTLKPGDDAPGLSKVMAASAVFLWVGVLFFGSMLPFLGNAF